MKIINSFLLVGLLICSAYGNIAFGVVGPFTSSAFKCLVSSGPPGSAPQVLVRGYQNSQSPPGIDPNAVQTLKNSFVAGYSSNVYIEICRGINATSQVNLVNTEIVIPLLNDPSSNMAYLFFIKVEPSSNPDCSWESYSHSDNCNFLTQAVNAVRNSGGFLVPTIFSTANIWTKFFGSSCDTFAADTGAYLQYANYNSSGNVDQTQSFDDYVPFGGWTLDSGLVVAKQVGGNVTIPLLCGNKAWHGFIDQVWHP